MARLSASTSPPVSSSLFSSSEEAKTSSASSNVAQRRGTSLFQRDFLLNYSLRFEEMAISGRVVTRLFAFAVTTLTKVRSSLLKGSQGGQSRTEILQQPPRQ